MEREAFITIPKRGLRVIPPPETRRNIAEAKNGHIVSWTNEEKARLKLLANCSILAKRYPTKEDGAKFMEDVDYEWLMQMRSYAHEMKDDIVQNWHEISPEKHIAVLLFGSVAKGLVKSPESYDPSNIDMSVIGDITENERQDLFWRIKPKREDIKQKIISKCPKIRENTEPGQGNAGVIIQNAEKLRKNNYSPALIYIASAAYPLHDPLEIWKEIESEAIKHYRFKTSR